MWFICQRAAKYCATFELRCFACHLHSFTIGDSGRDPRAPYSMFTVTFCSVPAMQPYINSTCLFTILANTDWDKQHSVSTQPFAPLWQQTHQHKLLITTVKHGGGRLMIWACFAPLQSLSQLRSSPNHVRVSSFCRLFNMHFMAVTKM